MKATVFTRQATVVFCMLILGSAGIISTTAAAESFDVALRQILRLSAGAAVMAAVSAVPFEKLKKLFPYGVAVSLVLLVVLLFSGTQINGMRGWFRYGSLSFQPSEPGKAFFLAGLITLLSADDSGKNPFIRKTVFPLLYLGVWLILLFLQPDMGTMLVYAATFGAVWFLAGAGWKNLAAAASGAVVSCTVFIYTHPYAIRRISGFLHPEDDPLGRGWHIRQLLRAISRGGWTGIKTDNAIWSRKYLPFSGNDSVFAVISEITGFAGAAITLLAISCIAFILFRSSADPEYSMSRKLYISGTAFMLLFQGFFHISVNIGLVPVSGITLPFVSCGGSSVISGALMLGISFSAMRVAEKKSSTSRMDK